MIYKIYKNTTRSTWSIKVKDRVVKHTNSILIKNPVFTCSQKTIERIRATKRKTPCAYVCGNIIDCSFPENLLDFFGCLSGTLDEVIFNPYQFTSFVFEKTKRPIENAAFCVMIYPKVYILNENQSKRTRNRQN